LHWKITSCRTTEISPLSAERLQANHARIKRRSHDFFWNDNGNRRELFSIGRSICIKFAPSQNDSLR